MIIYHKLYVYIIDYKIYHSLVVRPSWSNRAMNVGYLQINYLYVGSTWHRKYRYTIDPAIPIHYTCLHTLIVSMMSLHIISLCVSRSKIPSYIRGGLINPPWLYLCSCGIHHNPRRYIYNYTSIHITYTYRYR